MRHRAVRVMTWILSRLVPKEERAPLIGDLVEEHALRERTSPTSAASTWYLQQICASIPPLVGIRFCRAPWISTLGVGVLAYIAVGVLEFIVNLEVYGPSARGYSPLALGIVFPMVALIGYCAARFRRHAGIVLSVLMLLAAISMTVWSAERTPAWYRIAYMFLGPAAAFLGGGLRSRS